MTTARTMTMLVLAATLLSTPRPVGAVSPSPAASPSPSAPTATRTAVLGAPTGPVATATAPAATVTPTPRRTVAAAANDRGAVESDAPAAPAVGMPADEAPAAPLVQPRAYRTPERAAPPAFVGTQGGASEPETDMGGSGAVGRAPVMEPRPAARAGSSMVVFRVSARTALEGFDLRIGYPRATGSFGTASRPAECNAGTGMFIAANDRGDGEMRLLVASSQALPFPIDVFCRFTTESGAGIGAADFAVRVAEVTSDAKRADPGLLLVNVVVR